MWGRAKYVQGTKRENLPVLKYVSHGDERYRTGNTVGNPVIIACGDGGK